MNLAVLGNRSASLAAAITLLVSCAGVSQATVTKGHHKHHHHAMGNNIVCVADKAGTFKTLTEAIKVAGLNNTLEGKGPFTVFAPTDAAFAKLPKGTVDALLKDPLKLQIILKYHVVAGKLSGSEVAAKRSIKTLEGESLMVDAKDSTVIVDGAIVTKPDIEASNGVIHVIDSVLMPERGK